MLPSAPPSAVSCCSVKAIDILFGSAIQRYHLKGRELPTLDALKTMIRTAYADLLPDKATWIGVDYRDDACKQIPVLNDENLKAACTPAEAQEYQICTLYLITLDVTPPREWAGLSPPLPRDYPIFVHVQLWDTTPHKSTILHLRDVSSYADLLSKFPASVDKSALRLYSCVDKGNDRYCIADDDGVNTFAMYQSRLGSQLLIAYLARAEPDRKLKHHLQMDHLRINTCPSLLLKGRPRIQCVPASPTDDDAADSLTQDNEEWPGEEAVEPPPDADDDELAVERCWAAAAEAAAKRDPHKDVDPDFEDDDADYGVDCDARDKRVDPIDSSASFASAHSADGSPSRHGDHLDAEADSAHEREKKRCIDLVMNAWYRDEGDGMVSRRVDECCANLTSSPSSADPIDSNASFLGAQDSDGDTSRHGDHLDAEDDSFLIGSLARINSVDRQPTSQPKPSHVQQSQLLTTHTNTNTHHPPAPLVRRVFAPIFSVSTLSSSMASNNSTTAASVKTLKVYLGDDLRRFPISGGALPTLSALKQQLLTAYALPAATPVLIKYVDEDGELVTAATDADLNDAIDVVQAEGISVCRLYLVVQGGASPAAASAPVET